MKKRLLIAFKDPEKKNCLYTSLYQFNDGEYVDMGVDFVRFRCDDKTYFYASDTIRFMELSNMP